MMDFDHKKFMADLKSYIDGLPEFNERMIALAGSEEHGVYVVIIAIKPSPQIFVMAQAVSMLADRSAAMIFDGWQQKMMEDLEVKDGRIN